MSQEKEIVLLNDDAIPYEYATLVLTKVFGLSREEAASRAQFIDADGQAVVFTGSEGEAAKRLELLKTYNETMGQALQAQMQPAGTYVQVGRSLIADKCSVTLQFKDHQLDPQQVAWVVRRATGEPLATHKRLAIDLQNGLEVVIKEIEGDNAEEKAEIFGAAISHRLGLDVPEGQQDEDSLFVRGNIELRVRSAGSRLSDPRPLKSADDALEEYQTRDLRNLAMGFAGEIYEKVKENAIEKYGSIDEYLEKGPADEVASFKKVRDAVEGQASSAPKRPSM